MTDALESLPELDEDAMDEGYSDDAAHIQASLSQRDWQLPPINDPAPSDPFNVYDPSLIDLTEFVQLWFSHQTKQRAQEYVRQPKEHQKGPQISPNGNVCFSTFPKF